jgi:hypothetical protein
MKEYTDKTDFVEYATAKKKFDHLVMELSLEESQTLEHGDIEGLIQRDGNEILRCLMQGHLSQRAVNEKRVEGAKGADGKERRDCRSRRRKLETVFGEVEVKRLGYSGKNLESVFPMDAKLNLPRDKYSQGLRRKVGIEVSKGSFDEAVKAIKEGTGGKVPKRQSEQVACAISADFEEFYTSKPIKPSAGLLVMTTDGKGVVMRKEDLREHTRKAAERSKNRLETRLSRGEKRNRKRMATVASVYEVEPYHRTADQIMGKGEQEPGKRPEVRNKRVWASLRQEPSEVIEQMFAEAERRDPRHERTWLVLVDGQEAQLAKVDAAIAKHRPDTIIIQDFIHALEYLWKAAHCLYLPGTKEAEEWVMDHALDLLNGKASNVAAGMRRSATFKRLSQKEREPVDKCANYLLKNKERFDYATALANGWPIATGIIEGACRHLVKDRMDLTGARWTLDGGEAVLLLRSLYTSGDFEQYMEFHQRNERLRNYPQIPQNDIYEKLAA